MKPPLNSYPPHYPRPIWRDYTHSPSCTCRPCMARYHAAQVRLTAVLLCVLIGVGWFAYSSFQ